jgi:hypothetical protein
MLEALITHSAVSLVAGVMCIFLAWYVYRTNPYLRGSRAFLLLVMLGAVTGFVDFLLINAPDEPTAMLLARPLIFITTATAATLFYLSYLLPYERPGSWVVRHRRGYVIASLAVSGVLALMITSVERDEYGWWATMDWAVYAWMFVACLYCLGAGAVLVMASRRTGNAEVRRLSVILAFGAALPLLYGAAVLIAAAVDITTPALLSFAIFGTGVVFAYALFNQKLFQLEPMREEIKAPSLVMEDLRPGEGRLIEARSDAEAFRMFVHELVQGRPGLLVTRQHPDLVRERYGFVKTPIIWLSTQPGQDNLDPHNLSILQHTIIDFQQKSNEPVIMLDGLDYLLSYNPLDKVLRVVYAVRDTAAISGSRLIVPLDPNVMELQGLALLERELYVSRADDLVKVNRLSSGQP